MWKINHVVFVLIKLLRGHVETFDLYWFTQTELHSVLLYTTVKDSTNKKTWLQNKYYVLSLMTIQVFF